jgi:hypothetical protein
LKNIGIVALAALIALVLGVSANLGSTQTAHADVDETVAIGCEFLIGGIDGDPDDDPQTSSTDTIPFEDFIDACVDGIDATNVANLGDALGNEDGDLEASDFDDLDLDDNQIEDGLDGTDCAAGNCRGQILIFAFVDNDGTVTYDASTGLVVGILADTGGPAPDVDVNPETCAGTDDADCDDAVDDGDGVVVAVVTDGTADPTDTVDVDVEQDGVESTQTILVTGAPDEVAIEAIAGKSTIQTSDDPDACTDDLEVTDTDQFGEPNITAVEVNITDNDGTELTRVGVVLESEDEGIVPIPDEAGELGSDPSFDSGISVNSGDPFGIGYFALLCGGDETGVSAVTAIINEGTAAEEDASVDITVVGAPTRSRSLSLRRRSPATARRPRP